MRDSRKFCFPKTIKNPKEGDVLITLKNGKQVYISFKDLKRVKYIINNYVILENNSSSSSDESSDQDIEEIGSVNKSLSDLTITIFDNSLSNGTYTMVYEDSTGTPLTEIDKITEFTIS